MSSCSDCRSGVDHCHGTLVLHADGGVDCTDAACELGDLIRHAFVIDCAAVLGGCCAAGAGANVTLHEEAELAVAS